MVGFVLRFAQIGEKGNIIDLVSDVVVENEERQEGELYMCVC